MKSSALVLLGVVASTWGSALHQRQASNWTIGQTVQTSSGSVSGHASNDSAQVSEYLGIPFGQAPIGNLRFAAPVRFNGTAPLSGSKYGASCPVSKSSAITPNSTAIQAANVTAVGVEVLTILSNTGANYSEDCLYANVWTKPQVGEAKKAVLVWIYGGGFSGGSSSIPGYNGAKIAEQEDIVVVSFNYRLSILGFPGNPSTPNNLGLLDQRLAVEWIRDNIASFGGDPSRITIFGQSAGSASVDFYSYAWTSDPIVAGLIGESGTAFSWGLPNSKDAAASAWFNVTKTLGCGDATSDKATVLSCMRTKDSSDILNSLPASSVTASILGHFGPTVDDTVVFANYSGRTPAARPYIIGNNDYEGGLFRTEFALQGVTFPDVFWTDFNLQEFTCPAGIRANASIAAKNPTWRYRYMGVWPNLAVSSEAGTWHAAELPIIFNTAPALPPSTPQEIAFGDYMRGAWATFAKDPVNGLNNYGWPQYDPTKDTLIRLAYNNQTGINAVSPSVYDADCIYVNVSNTNASAYLSAPTPSGTSNGTKPSSTGSSANGSASGNAPPTQSPTSGAIQSSVSVLLLAGGFMAAYLL